MRNKGRVGSFRVTHLPSSFFRLDGTPSSWWLSRRIQACVFFHPSVSWVDASNAFVRFSFFPIDLVRCHLRATRVVEFHHPIDGVCLSLFLSHPGPLSTWHRKGRRRREGNQGEPKGPGRWTPHGPHTHSLSNDDMARPMDTVATTQENERDTKKRDKKMKKETVKTKVDTSKKNKRHEAKNGTEIGRKKTEEKTTEKKKRKRDSNPTQDENKDANRELPSPGGEDTHQAEARKKTKRKQTENGNDDPVHAAANGTVEENPETVPSSPNAIENFELCEAVQKALRNKGIHELFPIQVDTLDHTLKGNDLVGRARTGCGKTLAFVLPIVETLFKQNSLAGGKLQYGRSPSVICLAPTRELAKQVSAEFEYYGNSVGLKTLCVYGGSPYGPQEGALRRGVDVVVGTPGRVKDLLEKGTLKLDLLQFRVLDEADEMLNMGFVDDVELILGAVKDKNSVQTLLFSATMPDWVKGIAQRFQKPNKKIIDLVGTSKLKASDSVKHLLLPCPWNQRASVLQDVVMCYGKGGRTILFTETKRDANELSEQLGDKIGARALHGDIPQAQREVTLAGFRSSKFKVLVATDVAARGLDITGVDLVVQSEPPKDPETYIHRSGRTGRANSKGVSVTLVDRKKEWCVQLIERKAGVKFERVGAPQPTDMATAAANGAVQAVRAVNKNVIPLFKEAAESLMEESEGMEPVDLLSAALARIAGHSELKARSLLTAHDDAVTIHFKAPNTDIRTATFVWNFLRNNLPEDTVDSIRRLTLTSDGHGAVFDIPNGLTDQLLELSGSNYELEVATTLPPLIQKEPRPDAGGYRGGGPDRRGGFSPRGRGGFGRGGGGRGGGQSFGNRRSPYNNRTRF